jgi:hypothetical protein
MGFPMIRSLVMPLVAAALLAGCGSDREDVGDRLEGQEAQELERTEGAMLAPLNLREDRGPRGTVAMRVSGKS